MVISTSFSTSLLLILTLQLVASQSYHFSNGWSSGKRSLPSNNNHNNNDDVTSTSRDVYTILRMLQVLHGDADVTARQQDTPTSSNRDQTILGNSDDVMKSDGDVSAQRMVRLLQVLADLMQKVEKQDAMVEKIN